MPTKSVRYAYPTSPRGKKSGTWFTMPDNVNHPTYAAAFNHAETLPGEYDADTANQIQGGHGDRGTRYRIHRSLSCPVTGKTAWALLRPDGMAIADIDTEGTLTRADTVPKEYADDFKRHVDLLKEPRP